MNTRNLLALTIILGTLSGITAIEPALAEGEAAPATSGSAIMGEAMDGSSTATFEKGLEKVQTEATSAEYKTLQSAIKYLLMYDLSVKKNKAALYQKLDGKTPAEIIAKASR